jgi:hypothetical protein
MHAGAFLLLNPIGNLLSATYVVLHHRCSKKIKKMSFRRGTRRNLLKLSKPLDIAYKISLSRHPHSSPCSIEMTTFFSESLFSLTPLS